jgi:hypothetical protein
MGGQDRLHRQGHPGGDVVPALPAAAANAVILLSVVLLIIVALVRAVDIRKEL